MIDYVTRIGKKEMELILTTDDKELYAMVNHLIRWAVDKNICDKAGNEDD